MAALDMDGQSETNKSPESTQHAGLFLEGASSPSHKKRHCLTAMSPFGVPGRTRTVDIQNHNLSCIVIYPVDFHQVNELSICPSVNYK